MRATTAKIYSLNMPDTNEVFYIGCTVKALSERLYGHIKSPHLKIIFCDKVVPTIHLIEDVAIEVAMERENFWINKYLEAGVKLHNYNCNNKPTGVFRPDYYNDGRHEIKKPISALAAIRIFKTNMSVLENLIIAGTITRFKNYYTADAVFCSKELSNYFKKAPAA